MSSQVSPQASVPLAAVAPFFFVAPLGLAGAGAVLFGMSGDDFAAYNHPHVLAVVHALVLGWVTLTIFGATYQLGSAVLGGVRARPRLLWFQLATHVAGVSALMVSFRAWDLDWLHWVPALALTSVAIHIWTAQGAFRPSFDWSPTRTYLFVSNFFLVATVLVGATWAQMLDGGWIELTPSRIGAHAFLGLVGWLAVTLMGVHYQLIPMFMLVGSKPPRLARSALGLVVAGLLLFFVSGVAQQGAALWMTGVVLMASGCVLWLLDQIAGIKNRRRRKPDLYFVSILVSLGFFVLTVGLGLAAAAGIAIDGLTSASTRLLFAFFVTGVVGWMGTALVANSYKIVPFLIWFHRYSARAGSGPVPLLADMYSAAWAKVVVTVHVAATSLLLAAVVTRATPILMIAATALIGAALAHAAGLLAMLLPKTSSRPTPVPRRSSARPAPRRRD